MAAGSLSGRRGWQHEGIRSSERRRRGGLIELSGQSFFNDSEQEWAPGSFLPRFMVLADSGGTGQGDAVRTLLDQFDHLTIQPGTAAARSGQRRALPTPGHAPGNPWAVAALFLWAWVLPAVHGASIGFEASEGWIIGQPPPPGSGCALVPGYGDAPGVVAGSAGQSLSLPLSAVAQFDVSMPTTGVQHVGIDLAFTSPAYATGYFRDWQGLDFGWLQMLTSRSGISGQ